MNLNEIYLYRITHIDNISHILKYGITNQHSPKRNKNYVAIGDQSLIDHRKEKPVLVNNGEPTSKNYITINLGEFIPFNFGIKMPMLYVIQHGGNFVEKATHPESIVYLVCSLRKIIDANYVYYFTDGHATDNFTSFYDKSKVEELPSIIDWQALRAPYWGGNENLDLKRKKQAEFLILNDINTDCITGYICYNKSARQSLINLGIQDSCIKNLPRAYY